MVERGRCPDRRLALGLRELGPKREDHKCDGQSVLLDGAVLAAAVMGCVGRGGDLQI